MHDRLAGAGLAGRIRQIGLSVAAAACLATPASAKDVLYPTDPLVAMSVPQDWSIAETSVGLELQSPQKNSLVLARVVARDRASVEKWVRQAEARMIAEGVVFAKAAAPPKQAAGEPKVDPSIAHFLGTDKDTPFTFSGAPLVDKPALAAEDKPVPMIVKPVGEPVPPKTAGKSPQASAPSSRMRPTRHFDYSGSKLHGKPVDIELAIYPVGSDKAFLIEQESGPTDARGAMIVRSLKAAPGPKR